jgi:subtilisin-like proprotein convertase family protein
MRRYIILLAATVAVLAASAALASTVTETFTSTPNLAIPDATSGGPGAVVTSTMVVDRPRYITGIRVYMRLTTSASSDLRIWVESPYGTRIILLFIGEGGEPESNPAGWYPTNFVPYESMDPWLGEGMTGTWTIGCQDLSQGMPATLNEWRLELGYDDVIAVDTSTWSTVKALFD